MSYRQEISGDTNKECCAADPMSPSSNHQQGWVSRKSILSGLRAERETGRRRRVRDKGILPLGPAPHQPKYADRLRRPNLKLTYHSGG
jgi:hypothetical protein